jgi:hypothetical protein
MWSFLVLLVLLIPILAIVLDSQLGRALAQRLERRGLEPGESMMAERVGFLEGEVERLVSELQRLDEESQFLHKLLTERAGGASAPQALPDEGESSDGSA